MTNAEKGELAFGDYVLVLDINAICDAEGVTGRSLGEMLRTRMAASDVRAFVWAGLQRYHPGTTLTEAGNIVGAAGLKGAMALVSDAIRLAMPAASAEGKVQAAPAKPPKPKTTG